MVRTIAQRKQEEAERRIAAVAALADALRRHARARGGRYRLYGSAAREALRFDSDVDLLLDFPAEALRADRARGADGDEVAAGRSRRTGAAPSGWPVRTQPLTRIRMAQKPADTLATGPKDPVTGEVKPLDGPSERPGTEAERAARDRGAPPKPAQLEPTPPDAPPPGRRNRAAPGGGA